VREGRWLGVDIVVVERGVVGLSCVCGRGALEGWRGICNVVGSCMMYLLHLFYQERSYLIRCCHHNSGVVVFTTTTTITTKLPHPKRPKTKMAPIITASPSTYLTQPGALSSLPKKKTASKSFQSKSGGLHNINLTLSTRARRHGGRTSNSHIDLSNPNLPARDRQRLTQLEKTLPKLNGVVPAGVGKARGRKKGKRFVEDKESMLEILRLVNQVKEEKIEQKLEKGVSALQLYFPLLVL